MNHYTKLLKLLAFLGLIALTLWILWSSKTIILYFIVSLVVALVGRPLFHLVEKIKIKGKTVPQSIAAMLSLLALMAVLAAIVGIFLPLLLNEAQVLYNINFAEVKESLKPAIDQANAQLQRLGMQQGVDMNEASVLEYIYKSIDFKLIPSLLNNIFGVFGNVLIALFSVAFMSFFLLRDQEMMPRIILALTPGSKEESAMRIINNTRKTLSRYFIGLLIQVSAITLCVWIGLGIVGIKNALLIAFFTGLANLIPYLGPWIGATFGVFIMVSNNIGFGFESVILPKFYGLLVVFASTQLLDNYIFQPVIFSNSINAHPLEIFIVILVAGTIGGILGMVAAIPLYAFIRIIAIEMNREFGILQNLKRK
jgi:predicted PurR-regulated permease PerM